MANKPKIDKVGVFCELLSGKLPDREISLSILLSEFDKEIRKKYPLTSSGALGNSHGDWYEWILAISAWNYHCKNPNSFLALLLPHINHFDVARLYVDELYNLVLDLRAKVSSFASIQLVSSNPDFVLIDSRNMGVNKDIFSIIEEITPENITMIKKFCRLFEGKCDFDDIVGYISVKTSLRPDRRLQIPHEGSLMKAIYTHLQTRKWIISPFGLRYYAISTRVTDADRKALRTVATHSITTVHDTPQAAVDGVFEIDSLKDCEEVFTRILYA